MITAVVAVVLAIGSTVGADEWSDRTILSFSAPVMIPGATLAAGKYVFELTDTRGNRHLVRVLDEATNKVIALTQAVPATRPQPRGDVVVQFNPTERGVAPAIKGWFYPGSRYGHEFVYPEEQARHIAQRTKTVVLSVDVPESDLEKGVLRIYEPSGRRTEWQADAATTREWETWQRSRVAADRDHRAQASAPLVRTDFQGTRVVLDDLEDDPTKYIGQRISVDAEVEEVYGPRLFTIDEPDWGDLDGEILVLVPTPLAAFVREDDRVTISGTMRPFMRTEIEREWGWHKLDGEVDLEVSAKPILVAERLVGGDNNVVLMIDTTPGPDRPVGTSGTHAPIDDAAAIAMGNEDLVGRDVRLGDLKVTGTAPSAGGFFVAVGDRRLFVLPAQQGRSTMSGETVGISGVILRMPRSMGARLNAPSGFNNDIYVFATRIVK
jgi:hypothetical protein